MSLKELIIGLVLPLLLASPICGLMQYVFYGLLENTWSFRYFLIYVIGAIIIAIGMSAIMILIYGVIVGLIFVLEKICNLLLCLFSTKKTH